MNDINICGICGHRGRDVEWQENHHKSGYFCKDTEACFERFRKLREEEPTPQSGKEE